MIDESRRALWAAATICWVGAAISVAVLSAIGRPRFGIALAAGLLIGSASGPLALRGLASDLPYRMVSIMRLTVQSALAVGVGYLLGIDVIWVPMVGTAMALAMLALVAIRGVTATR